MALRACIEAARPGLSLGEAARPYGGVSLLLLLAARAAPVYASP